MNQGRPRLPAPESMVEALMFGLRQDGMKALSETLVRARLALSLRGPKMPHGGSRR